MAGNPVSYGAKNCESGLSAVSLRPSGLMALIPVNRKKNEIDGNFGLKTESSARPWGRRAVIIVSKNCNLVNYTGHSFSKYLT
jgi:hypothetical protein